MSLTLNRNYKIENGKQVETTSNEKQKQNMLNIFNFFDGSSRHGVGDFYETMKWSEFAIVIQLNKLYNERKSFESNKHRHLLNIITNTINNITPLLPYCRQSKSDEFHNALTAYKENLPILLLDIKPINLLENTPYLHRQVKYDFWNRKLRRNRWRNNWNEVYVTTLFTENTKFLDEINNYKQNCASIIDKINNEIYNNCENPTTLLNTTGLQSCDINNKITNFRNNIQIYKNHSNRVMEKIKNTEVYPQYAQAKLVDDQINSMYDWYPLDERSTINNGFAKLTKIQIENKLQLWETTAITLYNNCVDNNTHIGIDTDDIPMCIKDDYVKSAQKCGQAIQMSKVYDYGTDKLTNLWTDVSNCIPGNLKGHSMGILDSTNNSCTKWVDMFNVWQEEEAKALSEPCIPERSIINKNDPIFIKMANEWNKSASDHIKQLKARLIKIDKYVKNYPNILHLNKKDIIIAPYSMTPTANIKIKYDSSKDGESPNHYLEMIVPNGKPGEKGNTGYKGQSGYTGYSGTYGIEGDMGQYVKSR